MKSKINEDKINELALCGTYSDDFKLDNIHFRVFLDSSFYDDPKIYEILRNTHIEANNIFHDHIYYEILFIREGNIVFETKNEKYTLGQNTVIFIPKNVLHLTVYMDNCKYYSMGFVLEKTKNDENKDDLFNKINKLIELNDVLIFEDTYMIEMSERLSQNIKNNYFFSRHIINSIFREIILTIVKKIVQDTNDNSVKQEEYACPNFFYVINEKLNSLSDNSKLKEIANELFFSERQLSRIIKKQFGVSYMERKNIIRVESAKRLLADKNLSLEDIAEMVSFSSINSFVKIFKEIEGVSPTQYRKNI